MSASTETLVKLRALTGQARSKANVTVPELQRRKFKNKYSFNVRTNKVTALSNLQFGGNYSFQVPAFNSLVGEMWVELTLPAMNVGTYRKYPILHVIDEVRYNVGQRFYSFKPREVIPILLNRCRDDRQKTQLKAMFGGTVGAGGGTFLLPLITPMSVWQTDALMQPIEHGSRRGGIWDASKLSNNMVIELQMATRADGTSASDSAFTTASDLGNLTLYWEEVVCSQATANSIRAELPQSYCIEEYTRLDDQVVSNAADTTIKCASLVSRAGTSGFYFRCRPAASDSADLNCFDGDDHIAKLEVKVDGRDVYTTDDRSDEMRTYQDILAGNPGITQEPRWAHWFFGNTHTDYNASHISGLLKNGAVNELDLTIRAEDARASDRCDVIACHLRLFTFSNGTIKVVNAY
jgi:hypothetical protein